MGILYNRSFFRKKSDPCYEPLKKAAENGRLLQLAEISVQYVISKEQKILGKIATYNKLKDGVPIEVIPIEDARIWESLEEIFPYLFRKGMWGPINIQGRMTAEGPRFFEMNARFTGITGMRSMMGFNEVEVLIKNFLDLAPDSSPVGVVSGFGKVGMRQVADRIVPPGHYEPLKLRMDAHAGYTGKNKNEVVLVTGATGLLGRHIVRAMIKKSQVDKVLALVRDTKKAEAIFQEEVSERIQIISLADYHDSLVVSVVLIQWCIALQQGRRKAARP